MIKRFKDLPLPVLWEWINRLALLHFALLLFFSAIDLLVQTTASITNFTFNDLVSVIRNHFISFFIGILSTAILQHSSTTTSMAVAR